MLTFIPSNSSPQRSTCVTTVFCGDTKQSQEQGRTTGPNMYLRFMTSKLIASQEMTSGLVTSAGQATAVVLSASLSWPASSTLSGYTITAEGALSTNHHELLQHVPSEHAPVQHVRHSWVGSHRHKEARSQHLSCL